MKSSLLDALAVSCNCYISTLKNKISAPLLQEKLKEININDFTIEDWNYSLNYIFDSDFAFNNFEEIKNYIDSL